MEKLHRQPELHSLGQIRDLAGLWVDGTRADQDEIAARIGALSDGERTADRFGRSLCYGEPTQLEPEAGRLDTDLAALRESILLSLGTAAEYLEELKVKNAIHVVLVYRREAGASAPGDLRRR